MTPVRRINFALCSSDLAAKILPAESHIWRRLFRDAYDDVPFRTSVDYKIEYQIRTLALSRSVGFGHGQKERETYWLELLGNMIREALWQDVNVGMAKNFECIRKALAGTAFLNRPVCGHSMRKPDPPSDLFCAPTDLICSSGGYVPGFGSHYVRLIRNNFKLSTETALCIRNFWVRHLLNPDEDTFYTSYMNLPNCQRPAVPEPLGSIYVEKRKFHLSWLGYESCLCPYPPSNDLEVRQTCADLNGHIVEVEHIILQLEKQDDSENWPDLFEEYVTEYNDTDATTFFRGTQTYHGSGGDRSIPVRGFIEGVYGGGLHACWSRICWVAYVPSNSLGGSFFTELWPPANVDSDFNYIYGYEAVVVPGSSLMVGHWWDPRADEATGAKGPFIFWYIT
ncbi:hypothetical protein BDV10DRAFT_192662 [Aspergillus recurvatus]